MYRFAISHLRFVAFVFVGAGCSNQPHLIEVTGKVTMNGKPLGNVRVDFHPDPDKGTTGISSTAKTDAEGNFKLLYQEKTPGAIIGHHRIVITDLDVFGNVFVGRGDYRTDAPGGPKETPKKARFLEKFSNLANTPFKQEVQAGMGPVLLEVK